MRLRVAFSAWNKLKVKVMFPPAFTDKKVGYDAAVKDMLSEPRLHDKKIAGPLVMS